MTAQTGRLLNRDGTFNVARTGGRRRRRSRDVYHALISMTWPRFLAALVAAYAAINLAFGAAYTALGPGALDGLGHGGAPSLADGFFFSVQTFATIGYGHVSPVTLAANSLVTVEALVGLLCIAVATGIIFARFARPTARVLFTDRAIVGVHDGQLSLVFRLANERETQIVEAALSVALIRAYTTKEGEQYWDIHDLKLDRSRTLFFTLSWTVVHPIDAGSPLADIASDAAMRAADAEIMVSLTGIDDALQQTVHARTSYTPDDIVWAGRFADILTERDGRRGPVTVMDLDRFHVVEPPAGHGTPAPPTA
ncbi:MAG TPA: ion channel [Planctomycetota bacterium]|nr:ion channel [Planctomycetota bacterium]